MIVISKIIGGLGNQLFQYASSLALAKSMNADLFLDLSSFYNRKYNNPEGFLLKRLFDINLPSPGIFEYYKVLGLASCFFRIRSKINFSTMTDNYLSQVNYIDLEKKFFNFKNNNCYLEGYWQSEEYFKNTKETLLKDLVFKKNEISNKSVKLAKKLQDENSVSIHVRRKDYITNEVYKKIYKELSENYYKSAIQEMSLRIKEPKFYIFSDDIEWARKQKYFKNLNIVYNHESIGSWEDMFLMSSCKNNIIANSSYSWWGAWLNKNPNKIIIAPKKWFNGSKQPKYLLPREWLKL